MAKEEIRENEIEFLTHGKETDSVGFAWWNGKKVESDNPLIMKRLEDLTVNELTIDDGVKFLDELPNRFKSYFTARKV